MPSALARLNYLRVDLSFGALLSSTTSDLEQSRGGASAPLIGAPVHYQTVNMSAPDRGFREWYDSYWVPAVHAHADSTPLAA